VPWIWLLHNSDCSELRQVVEGRSADVPSLGWKVRNLVDWLKLISSRNLGTSDGACKRGPSQIGGRATTMLPRHSPSSAESTRYCSLRYGSAGRASTGHRRRATRVNARRSRSGLHRGSHRGSRRPRSVRRCCRRRGTSGWRVIQRAPERLIHDRRRIDVLDRIARHPSWSARGRTTSTSSPSGRCSHRFRRW